MSVRLNNIDVSNTRRVLNDFASMAERDRMLIAAEPENRLQIRYDGLSKALETMAMCSYALGEPPRSLRDFLRESIAAYEHVLRLRGTEEPFPVTVVTCDTQLPPSDPSSAKQEPLHLPGSKDYSLGNAGDSYRAACLAVSARVPDAARRIALQIWDPPKADWVGNHKYALYTVNDQHLAYAMRKFYENDEHGAAEIVSTVRPARTEVNDVMDQASMWKGLLRSDPHQFLKGLNDLLVWHRKVAMRDPEETDYYICVPALALCSLAIERGVLKMEQLPQANCFLPLDLLAA